MFTSARVLSWRKGTFYIAKQKSIRYNTDDTVMIYDFNGPLYLFVFNYFKDLIEKGGLKENDPLPSVRDVAVNFGINPNTVVKGYKELLDKGYIYSFERKGFFVKKTNDEKTNYLEEEIKKLLLLGYSKQDILDVVGKVKKNENWN